MVVDISEIWGTVLVVLKGNLSIPGYETFLSSASPISYTDGVLKLAVPNEFSLNWIKERCESQIIASLKSSLNHNILLDYQINPSLNLPHHEEQQEQTQNIHTRTLKTTLLENESNLNPKYTFNTFVVGNNNRFAHAAALAVAQAPAKAYNPLFVYGGVGLGKTHLMHAIGNKARELNPSLTVVYVSSEKFTNDLINSIRDDKTLSFREKYRNLDILLVDDIQFLAGKERTQEEFFHTFNSLHEANKQIVISSDRPPKEIPTLEERLRSRFEWGLSTDIQPPDLETRIAILRKKASSESILIPDEVLQFIAIQIPFNVRELEGALIRLTAYSSLTEKDVSIDLAEEVIKDIVSPKRDKPITINLIKKAVSDYFQIKYDELSAKVRTKDIALARQIAMYLSRELTSTSLPRIGENFGGRDHTTVMHACDKIKELISSNQEIRDIVVKLQNNIATSYE